MALLGSGIPRLEISRQRRRGKVGNVETDGLSAVEPLQLGRQPLPLQPDLGHLALNSDAVESGFVVVNLVAAAVSQQLLAGRLDLRRPFGLFCIQF